MNSKMRRTLAMLLLIVTIVSMIPAVSAATVTKVQHTSNTYGKNTVTFYVNAKDKKTTKLSYTCTRGSFVRKDSTLAGRYGYFEVQIWGRNSTSESWKYLSKTNIKNVSSTTLSMKGYLQYKVRVYAWNTATIGSYVGGNYNSAYASWCYAPTCTFKAKSNVSSMAK